MLMCIYSVYLMLGWYCVFTGRWWPWSSAQNRWTGLGAGYELALSCSTNTASVQQLHVRRCSLSATWHWEWKQRFPTCPFLLWSHPSALEPFSSYVHLGSLCWHRRSVSQKLNCVSYRQCVPRLPLPCRILSWVSWHLNVQWYRWNNSGTTVAVRVSALSSAGQIKIPPLFHDFCYTCAVMKRTKPADFCLYR